MMNKTLLVACLALSCVIFIVKDAYSSPQFNVGTGGSGLSGGMHPAGEMQNRTDSYPGSGYPGGYAERHGNESMPTPPSGPEVGGGMAMANSTMPSACDGSSSNVENVNNPTAPSGVPASGTGVEGDSK